MYQFDKRGDPGSAYLVNCPGGCVAAAGNVYGTMIYHKDSSICRAAIHCGALKDAGGLVQIAFSMTVEKLYKKYYHFIIIDILHYLSKFKACMSKDPLLEHLWLENQIHYYYMYLFLIILFIFSEYFD